jgi:vancomycin resistance protein YoaR
LISILVIAALGLWAHRQVETYERFQEMREVVARQTFYDGIAVDGVSVSGMSMEQALEAFSWRDDQENASFEIYLTAGESRWRISSNEVSLHRNTETTLRQAYSIGRVGTLEERYNIIMNMRQAGTSLSTQMWYDHTAIRNLTAAIAQSLSIEGRDAGVSGFDFNTRTFTFTSEMAGQTVDADALYNQVVEVLDREEYGSSIEVSVIHVEPKVTRDQVASLYGKVAGFTTQTTSSANRNANISLATQAINGSVLQPGEILSFNEKTGQRTYAKGYREAGAIQNGRLIDEVGGGVCQVSTTLFNAMVRANLTIVTRNPHAWPVDYVQRGEDAMVNWPDKDLKMQNNTDSPIYIIGSYANRSLSFEIYGRNIDNGMVIDLESVTTKTIPPSETVYTRDSTLAQGTEKVIRQARTGYQVTTYKVFYQNGKEVSREQFYKSEYKMYGKQVNYNN